MPSSPTKKIRGADSVQDVDKLVQLELARLQRQYRLIEDQRHGYTHESGTTARTTYRMVDNLQKEKENLIPDLKNATCPSNQARAKLTETMILEIVERYDKYTEMIQKEIRHIKEMEEQVDKISERVVKQKLKILSLYGMSITPAKAERKLEIAENKLYHMTTLFDEKCHQNLMMRRDIKNLLRERTRFHKKHNYLKDKVALVKNQMLHVVHQAALTYDNRDESVTKIKAIREREHKESKQHVLEIKEFQRVLHHDHKIHRFLVTKNKERDVFEDAAQRLLRKDEQKEREVDELLEKYRQSIKQILSHARFQSVDQLCAFYNDLQQQNYAKFMFITDVTHECETLKEAIGIIREDIDQSHKIVAERKKFQMEELRNRHEKILAQEKLLKHLHKSIDRGIEKSGKFVQGISTAFDLARCSNSSILQLLGNHSGVSQRNALLCLGILEHQITKLKLEKSTLEVRKGVEIKGHSLHSYKTLAQSNFTKTKSQGGPFKADMPILNHLGANAEEEDEKEMYDCPYYFHEMRAYVYHQMKEEGLITDQNLNLSTSDVPTENASVSSSTVSLLDKVTSKKKARRRAQQEQERNLATANKQTANLTDDVSSEDGLKFPTSSQDISEIDQQTTGEEGQRSSSGYKLTWAPSIDDTITYVTTTTTAPSESSAITDSIYIAENE